MTREDLTPIHHQVEAVEFKYPQTTVGWSVSPEVTKNFAQLIWLESGATTLQFRRESIDIKGPRMIWVPTGMLKHAELKAGCHGIIVNVSEDWLLNTINALPESDIPYRQLIDSLHNYALSDEQLSLGISCIETIQKELNQNLTGMRSVILSQLATMLTYIYRHEDCVPLIDRHQHVGSTISQRFLQQVELHFHEHWRISDYAQQLGVTDRRLELTLQRDFNESPINLIHRKLIAEATHRLENSALSISEIAYGLGYRDPSYFNRFFKRLTGYAPGAWRKLTREHEDKLDHSYAAWP